MSKLPMYETLLNKVRAEQVTVTSEHLSDLAATLNSLTLKQAEQVSLLILHHINLESPDTLTNNPFARSLKKNSPYDIRISQGKGFSFDILKLPVELQTILCSYCSIV